MVIKAKSTEESDARLEKALDAISPKAQQGGEGGELATSAPETGIIPEKPETTPQGGEETPPEGGTPPESQPAGEQIPETPPAGAAFDLETFNKQFGSDFADEDTLKSSLTRLNDLQEFDALKTERDELQGQLTEIQSKYEEAKDLHDPRKYFVNEEEYKRQLILQQHGQELNPALLNRIVSADLDAMNDIEVLALGKQVANPNILGGEAGAREMIYQQLGVDPEQDPAEWTQLTKNMIAEAARGTRKELSKIKSIEVPEKIDFEAQRTEREQQAAQAREQLTNSWSPIAEEMVNGFSTLDLSREGADKKQEVYFSYEVDNEFKKAATDLVIGYLVDSGLEPSKENVRKAKLYVQDLFWRQHGNAIVQAYGRDVEAKLIEKHNIEVDNPKPPSEQEAPAGDLDKQTQELVDYVKEDLGKTRQAGEKLFGNS